MKEYNLNLTIDSIESLGVSQKLTGSNYYVDFYIGYDKHKTNIFQFNEGEVNNIKFTIELKCYFVNQLEFWLRHSPSNEILVNYSIIHTMHNYIKGRGVVDFTPLITQDEVEQHILLALLGKDIASIKIITSGSVQEIKEITEEEIEAEQARLELESKLNMEKTQEEFKKKQAEEEAALLAKKNEEEEKKPKFSSITVTDKKRINEPFY